MKVTVKNTICPLCCGELVIDDNITCIEGHDLDVEFDAETMAKLQPVIDWQDTLYRERQRN